MRQPLLVPPQPARLASPHELTLLESALPVRELSLVVRADRRATDPIYGAHRWWARRPPALMRALLIAQALAADSGPESFWEVFADTSPALGGLRVHDPFLGGGSTVVEAARLGAQVSGSDIDPLAVEIVRHELAPADADVVRSVGTQLLTHLADTVGDLYGSTPPAAPLHYFWLHEVTCPFCQTPGLLYRSLILARDTGRAGAVVRDRPMTVFCPIDLTIHHLDHAERRELWHCGRRLRLAQGTYSGGRYNCPTCRTRSTHRDLQTGVAPRRLIAVEETRPDSRRELRGPTDTDLVALTRADEQAADTANRMVPEGQLSLSRRDDRPLSYGIDTPAKLFTNRQLVVLGTAMAWLRDTDLEPGARRALTLALSNCLATNNKLCSYATDYGRLSSLFSVRGYPLPALSVELNPLHQAGGRGTLRGCIERVARSSDSEVRRHIWSVDLGKPLAQRLTFPTSGPAEISCTPAETPAAAAPDDPLIDLCLFDPPYFDYIAYSELSEFYRAWLDTGGPSGPPLLPRGEDPAERFGLDLGACLRALLPRLAPGRPLAFTYHSANPQAWSAIGVALDDAKLAVTALWPVRSDGHMGHHSHPGNCEWDLVVVCRPIDDTEPAVLSASADTWERAVAPLSIGAADRTSLSLAIATCAERFARPGAPQGGPTA